MKKKNGEAFTLLVAGNERQFSGFNELYTHFFLAKIFYTVNVLKKSIFYDIVSRNVDCTI